jgi:hypothetical protein
MTLRYIRWFLSVGPEYNLDFSFHPIRSLGHHTKKYYNFYAKYNLLGTLKNMSLICVERVLLSDSGQNAHSSPVRTRNGCNTPIIERKYVYTILKDIVSADFQTVHQSQASAAFKLFLTHLNLS